MFSNIIWSALLFAITCSPVLTYKTEPDLEILAEWKNLVFAFDSPEQEQWAIEHGYQNSSVQKRPYDSDIYETPNGELRIFASIPRIQAGVAYSLVELKNGTGTEKSPLLQAYPNTEMHFSGTCDGIISVFRIWVQANCNHLYVVDTGRDFMRSPTQQCPPKLIVFDLLTDTVKYSYVIPASQYTNDVSMFNGINVLPSLNCDYAKAYITDPRGPGLLVLERQANNFRSWLIKSKYFDADPNYYNVTIANETFSFIDALYTAAPSIRQQVLYFHPFASLTEYAVPLPLVDYEKIWKYGFNLDFLFNPLGQRPTQSSIQVLDSRNNLWFTLMEPLAIFCWNPRKPYNYANFKKVIENSEAFQYVVGLKIRYLPGKGETIVGISNRLQKHNTGTVNPNEINYRIFTVPIGRIKC